MAKDPKSKHAKSLPGAIPPGSSFRKNYLLLPLILAVTLIVFTPSLKSGFVTFDDPHYVLENPYIRNFSAENLEAILLTDANNLGNYHPLTLLSYAVNYSLSELDPAPYHAVNIFLHLVNTFLVFQLALLLFERAGSGEGRLLSAAVALLFGIHPLHVESVAWISGRKDLLYTCFYLLSLISYTRYAGNKSAGNYLLSFFFFLMSLLSKGMAVTLSLSVVAIDYLLKRDLFDRKVILEKIPFFMLSLIFGIIAVVVQQAQGATEIIKFSFFERVVFASWGYTQYLIKFIVPYKLCGYYPYPDLQQANIPAAWYFAVIPAVTSIAALLFFIFHRPDRNIVFGGMFFIVNVMFVLQIFPVGSAVMADRYTYLSSFGFFFLAAAGIGHLIRKFSQAGKALPGIFLVFAVSLSAVSIGRIAAWHDSYSFWNDVMNKYPAFYPAINNLGEFYENEGKAEEALQLFSKSIEANRQNPNAWFHRGSIRGKTGKLREAISDFDQAILCNPGFTQAYVNRAIAKAMSQDYPGALADLDTVIGRGGGGSAYFNRGLLKNQLRDYAGAIPDFQEAVNLDPSCVNCIYSLGLAHYHTGKFGEAIRSFSACLELDPSSGNAYYYRGLAYQESGKTDSCCSDLQKAVSHGIKEAIPAMEQCCRH